MKQVLEDLLHQEAASGVGGLRMAGAARERSRSSATASIAGGDPAPQDARIAKPAMVKQVLKKTEGAP